MPINTNAEQVQISPRNYKSAAAEQENDRLLQFLKGMQGLGNTVVEGQQSKDLMSQKASQDLSSLLKKKEADAQGVSERTAQGLDLMNDNPLLSGVNLSESGVSLQRKDNTLRDKLAQDRLDTRKTTAEQTALKGVVSDYSKAVGQSPARVLAIQSVLKALDRGDITTLGSIKANLPTLEGETRKATDAERNLMFQPTAEGAVSKLKNYFAGDSAGASASQLNAIRKFATDKVNEEQGQIDRSRSEVLGRWKPSLTNMSPEQISALQGSLGMGSEEILHALSQRPVPPPATATANLVQGLPGKPNLSGGAVERSPAAPPAAPSTAVPSFEEFKRLKSEGKI